MLILNLGSGTKASAHPDVVNIDWSVYLRLRRNRLLRPLLPLVLRGSRLDRLRSLPGNIRIHNLAKGIPYDDESANVVYHSHLLEHMERPSAIKFLREIYRVLKPGGVVRIVVPDFEKLSSQYLRHVQACDDDPSLAARHDAFIAAVIEQSVRREASGTSSQGSIRRAIENLSLGDARQRGETHQWMYDRISLASFLADLGFTNITRQGFDTSLVEGWWRYGLDRDESGEEYKPGSLYMEATK